MVPICCPETSVKNYRYALRNCPEERSSQLLRGGGLESDKWYCCSLLYAEVEVVFLFEERMQIVAVHKQSHVEDSAPNREEVTGLKK